MAKDFYQDLESAMVYVNKIRKVCEDIENEGYREAIEDQFNYIIELAGSGITTIKGI